MFESRVQALQNFDGLIRPLGCLNPEPWIREMARVPHLKIDFPEFSVARALAELDAASVRYAQCSLRTPQEAAELGPLLQPYWYASALVNYNSSSESYFCKLSKEVATLEEKELQAASREKFLSGLNAKNEKPCATALNWGLRSRDMDHYKTELWMRLPYITGYVSEHIGEPLYRCWFMLIKAGGYLNWHSHARLENEGDFFYDKFIVHIPLVTNPRAVMHVMMDDEVHSQHYAPGETWILNSMQNHSLENLGNEDRVHLVITTPTSNRTLSAAIQKAMRARR